MERFRSYQIRAVWFLAAIFLFMFCFAGTAWAEEEWPKDIRPVPDADLTGKVVVLHTNDVHGAIQGYAKIVALRESFEKLGAEVILADAGDFSQGDPRVNLSSGADAITMMNAAGYSVATLGNHEFDYGYERLRENLSKAEFRLICANIFENGTTVLEPHWIYTAKNGAKIGFFGLDTEESKTKANPNKSIGLTFCGGDDMYRIAAEQVQELRQEGADVVIALTHLGVDKESAPAGNRSLDLWNSGAGMDLVIDGHSHTSMTSGENGEVIQSTGSHFGYIGAVVIGADGKIEDHYLMDTKLIEADEASAAEIEEKKIEERVDAELQVKVCSSEVILDGDWYACRSQETNSGDLVTDAMLWQIRKDPALLKVPEDHLIAIMNGGGIRETIPAGDVTKKNINLVYPFSNTLRVTYVTGEELLELLEASTFCTPEPVGGFPQTGGIEWTIDTTKEFDDGGEYPGSTFHAPDSIRRVTVKSVNGRPFRPEDTYAVICSDFLASGGDTYFVLATKEGYDTGLMIDDVMIAYIREELGGVVPASKYGKVRGDIEIIGGGTAAEEKSGEGTGDAQNSVSAAEEKSGESTAEVRSGGNVYEVQRGDCLWDIAEKVYGDGYQWRRIYENNRDIIRRPDVIRPGQILKLPDAA